MKPKRKKMKPKRKKYRSLDDPWNIWEPEPIEKPEIVIKTAYGNKIVITDHPKFEIVIPTIKKIYPEL